MTYSRTTTVSDATGGDSVLQGCQDLDTDLTLAFTHLNTVAANLSEKIPISDKGAASGVCDLDADGLVPVSRIPIIPSSLLPSGENCPVGTVVYWPSTTVPDGFLECDGKWLSKTEYDDLYSVIGGIYGSNTAKFRLPDYRGYFLRGWNHSRTPSRDPDEADREDRGDGTDGDAIGTIQESAVLSHNHYIRIGGYKCPVSGSLSFITSGSTEYNSITTDGGKESRPINISMLAIIKV